MPCIFLHPVFEFVHYSTKVYHWPAGIAVYSSSLYASAVWSRKRVISEDLRFKHVLKQLLYRFYVPRSLVRVSTSPSPQECESSPRRGHESVFPPVPRE